ncbi:holo-ACP synthase [Pedosphaera parvula]|uniref:4'-phosphopantetheinyl transferase n=1 Tax=Pedosphaera parvula (strain Ellin514) TaxID=320771 RepID=B9XBZ4_PEDPL|nr:4'-phosphopantetheinyl transferase superfamily protein [Pedosphaera parvula]EEF62462.1 4'-phosphopantetheinyl transferase [Pedosphaera parvula Ellin514]
MNHDLDKIRSVVARYFQVEEAAVTEEFIFPRERLQGSAARDTFHAALKRMAGIDLTTAHTANSYAELIRQDASVQQSLPMPALRKETRPDTNGGVEKGMSERALIGIDIEQIDNMPWSGDPWSEPFYLEHFTDAEIAYCLRRPEPKLSFCGVWAAKEAVIKCCEMLTAFHPRQIEVMHDDVGRPRLSVEGWNHGAHPLALSISHAGPNAVAVCVCVNNAAQSGATAMPNMMPGEDEPVLRRGAGPGLVWGGLIVAALSLMISLVLRLF